jgi:hypothetical protein
LNELRRKKEVGSSKDPESPEFSSVDLRLRAEITSHEGNSTVFKPCRKHCLKHCLTCFMREFDRAFGRAFDREFGREFGRAFGRECRWASR